MTFYRDKEPRINLSKVRGLDVELAKASRRIKVSEGDLMETFKSSLSVVYLAHPFSADPAANADSVLALSRRAALQGQPDRPIRMNRPE